MSFDVKKVREDFPILRQKIHGKPLVYLDNAATTQKPQAVIEEIARFYSEDYANVHRGLHLLSERATAAYEHAREKVRKFVGAASTREIVFTSGTTDAINLVAWSYGRRHVGAGDEVVVSAMEHHSDIVPWQLLCEEKGARLVVLPIDDAGQLMVDQLEPLLTERTRLVAVAHVSNALGTVNPIRHIVEIAHRHGVPVLVDGAQAVAHLGVDVRALDCDFYAFSAHKIYGPSGVGVLYGKEALLEAMPPFKGGGNMIRSVTFEKSLWNSLPYKFEAGTPDIAGVVGLGTALDYVSELGLDAIARHEDALLRHGTEVLSAVPGLRMIGTAREKASILSFVLDGVHAHDVGTILDQQGIAVRAGHHCAQPVMERFGLAATARASLGLYNTRDEVDALARGLNQVLEVFR